MKKSTCHVLVIILILFSPSIGLSAPIQWEITNGGNDHWYDALPYLSTWDEANEMAQTMSYNGIGGHLATLTSADENRFVWESIGMNRYWLGGYQVNKLDEPAGNWAWVTGETWNYTNWASPEPNDYKGEEQHLQFVNNDGTWNDNNGLMGETLREPGFVIEYESPSIPVPEPATFLLLTLGLAALGKVKRRDPFRHSPA